MSVDSSIARITLKEHQEQGRVTADRLWLDKDTLKQCPAHWVKGMFAGKRCPSKSGRGIWPYEGLGGPCMAHGGAKKQGRATGAWLMAHQFAQELDVSPWEALLLVIRITAGRLRYIESVLAMASSDSELDGSLAPVENGMPTSVGADGEVTTGRNLTWWVEKSETERDRLAKVSKAAIDAGVAQLLIEKELRNGEELAGTFVKVLSAMENAGMMEDALDIARMVMRKELQLALGS